MATDSKKQLLQTIRERRYLNRDFDSFRADLLEYARIYFPDRVKDFSDAGLPGLLMDMAAYVGDVQSFYLDHQFQENFAETSEENDNIERHLKSAGVPIVGASPAVVTETIYFQIPASGSGNSVEPSSAALPIIHAGTVVKGANGTEFELTEDIDFSEEDNAGNLLASVNILNVDANNIPTTFIVARDGICISGFRATESFQVNGFEPFKKITLAKENITEVVKVKDTSGNEYYEVGALTEDTVFKAKINRNYDGYLVKENIVPIPAPYRFTKEGQLASRLTTLTFGGGSAETLNDDIIPDPSEFAVPLYGKKVFSKFAINPGNLLQTTTLGVLTPNTTITIEYRYGGGLRHNVDSKTIRNVSNLIISFPRSPSPGVAQFVRNSIDCTNTKAAAGGEEPPTTDELKTRIPAFKASQGRIVSRPDVLARIYTMPSNFGRVFRASVANDPNNPLASRLYIISRNQDSQLIVSPDSLKKNLATYLNTYRMVSDAIDILDARIINIKLDFQIVVDPTMNRSLVLKNVINRLKKYFDIKNFDIDQPIVLADLQNIIFNNDGVISVQSVEVKNVTGNVGERVYSGEQFDIPANTYRGIVFPPVGAIFELRFKDLDIVGVSV